MKLSVISDTNFYIENEKTFVFHSVSRELNAVDIEIKSFLGLKVCGKSKLLESLNQEFIQSVSLNSSRNILAIVKDFVLVRKCIKNSDIIHVRGPSPAMVYAALISFFYPHKKYWFKYANDWSQKEKSIFWNLQKCLLIKNTNIKTTINGNWPNLPKHIVPFENPCFYCEDIKRRDDFIKNWETLKRIVFVGRMTQEKGIFRILESLRSFSENDFDKMLFIGTGKDESEFFEVLSKHPLKHKIQWIGGISKDDVMRHLRESHLLLLPTTEPEGFPKVISEAWLSKCIPITSDISCISEYVINGKTGFIQSYKEDDWVEPLKAALSIRKDDFEMMEKEIKLIIHKFTYEYFRDRILNEVIGSGK